MLEIHQIIDESPLDSKFKNPKEAEKYYHVFLNTINNIN
jgi:hypothetical protein